MITVKIGDTTFICSTASEAVLIHRLASNTSSAASTSSIVSVLPTNVSSGSINGTTPAHEFLNKLREYNGQELDSVKMAVLTGVESANGVGPRLGAFRRVLESQNPPLVLNDYLVPRKNPDGTTMWRVRFNSTEQKR